MTNVHQHFNIKDERFYALLGPLRAYLDDQHTQNIMVNEDGSVFVDRFGSTIEPFTMLLEDRVALISYLANAQLGGTSIDHLHSRLQADLPMYHGRIQAFSPPIANWALIIRLHARKIYTLQDYVDAGDLQQRHCDLLNDAIASQENIAIAGNVNSGKTTFLNACLESKCRQFPSARAVIVQDRHEIQADGFANRIFIMAKVEQASYAGHASGRSIYGFSDALEDALRANGDFLVWGEVRDGASAHGLAMATNTGSRGLMMTTHANSCLDTLYRLEDLLLIDGKTPIRRMIARMINVLVYMERDPISGQRRILDIQRVTGVNTHDDYILSGE